MSCKSSKEKTRDNSNSQQNLFAGLMNNNLPIIYDLKQFSLLLSENPEKICKMAYCPKYYYRSFEIKKSNGKIRIIDAPISDLKKIQRWILDEILIKEPVTPYAKAFVKGQTLKHNACFHRAKKVLVTVDIKDFFKSIKIYDIYDIFLKMGYKKNIASMLSNLCCLNGSLPQGAPTSPYLSNLRMREIDEKIANYCFENKLIYSRYCDDLTFSGCADIKKLIRFVSCTLFSEGFILNPDKTRVAKENACQQVTGIVVNDFMQVSKKYRKNIRQQIYYINKYGLNSHKNFINETSDDYHFHLLGRINFALFVNPKDKELKNYLEITKKLINKLQN